MGHPPLEHPPLGRSTAWGGVALVLWSLLAFLSRAAWGLPPFELTAMAFTVSGTLGLVWLWRRGELGLLRQPPMAWLHGVGGLFGYHALFFAALAHAPAAEANLINYLWPLLILLLSAPILGLRLSRFHLIGVFMGLGGSVLLLSRGINFGAEAWTGYACALAAAWAWALYSVLARRLRAVPSEAVVGFCVGSAVLAWVAHLAFETTVSPDGMAAGAVLLLGVGPVGVAFFLWDIGMKHGDPRLLGTLAYATPVVSTVILGLAGFASLSALTIAAAVLVGLGGWVSSRA